MDFRKIFSKAIKYPLNLQAFVLLFAVNIVLSYSGGYLAAAINPADISSLITSGLSLIPAVIVGLIITIFLMALYIDNAAKYFSSKRKSLLGSLPAAKKKFIKVLGIYVLIAVLYVAAAAIFAVGFSLGMLIVLPALAVLFIVTFFVFLAPYIAVVGKSGIIGSIKASASTVNKNKLNMLIFWILYLIISITIELLPLPVYLIDSVSATVLGPVNLILQSLIASYSTLFAYSAFTNFYLSAKK